MSRTLLFCDDHHVLYRSGTVRLLHRPARHPANPLIAPPRPWEVALAWTSGYRDPQSGRYQLWYQAYTGDVARERTHRCVVCYAESDDGVHFVKPELDLFAFNEVQRTNIVLVGSGGHSLRYANSVVVDPRDPDPDRRYKMAYFDFEAGDEIERPGLCVAFSPDGIHWTKHPDQPLLRSSYGDWGEEVPCVDEEDRPWAVPLSMSDGGDVLWDPLREVFAVYGKMWIDGPAGRMYWKHAMGRSESRDFVHWSRPEIVCFPDELDSPHVEFHTTPVFYHRGLYCGLNQVLNRGVGGGVIDVEVMFSRDGLDWQRPFRDQFFIARSAAGHFDSGSIFTNSTPVILDDEIRFYYGGYSQGATSADDRTHISGVGLATVPLDRFAGIAPMAKIDTATQHLPCEGCGQITLKPLELSAQLSVNADASSGSVRVEVLDAAGRRVRGFTRDDAVPIEGDSPVHQAVWKKRRLADLPQGSHMLRLHLDRATVYAVTV